MYSTIVAACRGEEVQDHQDTRDENKTSIILTDNGLTFTNKFNVLNTFRSRGTSQRVMFCMGILQTRASTLDGSSRRRPRF